MPTEPGRNGCIARSSDSASTTTSSGATTPLGTGAEDAAADLSRPRGFFRRRHTLTDATVAALDASAALIVLCSTVAATRPAVNEEVRLFRSRHPERPVIPVIIEGTYPDNFPPALRYELAADGSRHRPPGDDPRARSAGERATARRSASPNASPGWSELSSDEIFRRAERRRAGGRRVSAMPWLAGVLPHARNRRERQRRLCLASAQDQRGVPRRHARSLHQHGQPRRQRRAILFAAASGDARLPGGGRRACWR